MDHAATEAIAAVHDAAGQNCEDAGVVVAYQRILTVAIVKLNDDMKGLIVKARRLVIVRIFFDLT